MFQLARASIDTSVIIEYIDEEGECHEQAEAVFSAILAGKIEAIIPHSILVETYYVTARIYQKLGVRNPKATATKLIEWLYRLPTVTIADTSLNLALEVGKIKLRYKLAITDCYVLATSKIYNCTALFKKPEKEMLKNINQLKKNYKITFLKDYR